MPTISGILVDQMLRGSQVASTRAHAEVGERELNRKNGDLGTVTAVPVLRVHGVTDLSAAPNAATDLDSASFRRQRLISRDRHRAMSGRRYQSAWRTRSSTRIAHV
jgi:hypothetical protein